MSEPARESLYDRIGGESTVARLVDDFYERVLADGELAAFFDGVSMDKLRSMQREFFAAALDGEVHYTGRPLWEAHRGLGITAHHLQRFLQHLFETIEAREELDEEDQLEVISRINRYVDDITGRGPFAG